MWDLVEKQVFRSRDIIFMEDNTIAKIGFGEEDNELPVDRQRSTDGDKDPSGLKPDDTRRTG